MAHTCPRCTRTVQKLIAIPDIEGSASASESIGFQVAEFAYFCVTCAREILSITDQDLVREERLLANDTVFHLSLIKGRFAQVLIEVIFEEFGYEVYPYGYESYLTNVIKHMKKGSANLPVRKIRASPDLFVYDREANDGFLVEVKATSTRNESHYWISKSTLDTYRDYWPEAILVIYCIPSGKIYCKQIGSINTDNLPTEYSELIKKTNYVVNLEENFLSLPNCFPLIEKKRYQDFSGNLRQILGNFADAG